jgi:hypothetical protein
MVVSTREKHGHYQHLNAVVIATYHLAELVVDSTGVPGENLRKNSSVPPSLVNAS